MAKLFRCLAACRAGLYWKAEGGVDEVGDAGDGLLQDLVVAGVGGRVVGHEGVKEDGSAVGNDPRNHRHKDRSTGYH